MKYASFCSGIEAASVAWKELGWEPLMFSEIEPFPKAVLAHHFPNVPDLGDMTQVHEKEVFKQSAFDLFIAGTPCQSFSVAGLRKGLDDPRGNLMLTFGRLAAIKRPRWILWENVPGVLSSNGGADFASFLGLLSGRGIEPPKNGWKNSGIIEGYGAAYGLAWRVLDAQYFGVAQRRRRVFVVGYLGDWRSAAAVLFESHSLSGNPAPSRKARQGVANGTAKGVGSGGIWPAETASTLNAAFGDKQGYEDQHALSGAPLFVPHAIAADLYNQSINHETSQTLSSAASDINHTGGVIVPHAFKVRGGKDGGGKGYLGQDETAFTVSTGQDQVIAQPLPFDTTQITSPTNGNNPKYGDPVHPLAAQQHAPAIVQQVVGSIDYEHNGQQPNDAMGPLLKGSPTGGGHPLPAVVTHPRVFQQNTRDEVRYISSDGQIAGALAAEAGAKQQNYIHGAVIRRLTPKECSRLQGFPDDWAKIPYKGKPAEACPDGNQYKAYGNSMAVPVINWLGKRIEQVNQKLLSNNETNDPHQSN